MGIRATVTGIRGATWSFQCDECRTVYMTQTWKFPRAAERERLAVELSEAGWFVDGDHVRHVCPECVAT